MPNLKIYLKDKSKAEFMNKVLKKRKIDYTFASEESNQDWLDDINNNPESYQAHLKPAFRDLTMDELKKMFKPFTKVGLMDIDLSFGRCEDEQMTKIVEFIKDFKSDIRFIKGGADLIERGEVEDKEAIEVVDSLNRLPLPAIKKPKSMRREMPKSGQMLAKTWGPDGQKVWLIFGGVDKDQPIFLKTDEYARKEYNSLHKDKEGRAFLMMPLYDFSENFAEVVSTAAQEMSIREHPNYLLCGLYSGIFGFDEDKIKDIATAFSEFYTKEELVERLEEQAKKAVSTYGIYNGGISYNGECFKANGGGHERIVSFLNSLHMALALYSVKEAQTAASKAYEQFV